MSMFWVALLLGLVEGLTEFLPISSTGHLIVTSHLVGFEGERAELFEICIQLGAILAVLWEYRIRLLRVVIDGDGRIPLDSALLNTPGDVLWAIGDDIDLPSAPLAESVTIHKTPRLANGKIDLSAVIAELGNRGLHNVMIEAGGVDTV